MSSLLKKVIKELNRLGLTEQQERFKHSLEIKMHTTKTLEPHELQTLNRWNSQDWKSEKLAKYISIGSPVSHTRKLVDDKHIEEKIDHIHSEIKHSKYKLERSKSMEHKRSWSRSVKKSEAELEKLESQKQFLSKVRQRDSEQDLMIIQSFEELDAGKDRGDVLIAKIRKLKEFMTDKHSPEIRDKATIMHEKLIQEYQETYSN